MPKLTAEFERVVIQAALSVTGGKKIEAATRLGMGRNTIARKIEELKIDVVVEK
jgi:two-component system nitrogen regulation response regulator GlnG